jgi:hypothetical protein
MTNHELKNYYWASDTVFPTIKVHCTCGWHGEKVHASANAFGRNSQARALIAHHRRLEREKQVEAER